MSLWLIRELWLRGQICFYVVKVRLEYYIRNYEKNIIRINIQQRSV